MQVTSSDVHAEANAVAEWLNDDLTWDVAARKWGNDVVIVVTSPEDHISTNGFAKASVINDVLAEAPQLEVRSTEDGDMTVTFRFSADNK